MPGSFLNTVITSVTQNSGNSLAWNDETLEGKRDREFLGHVNNNGSLVKENPDACRHLINNFIDWLIRSLDG